MLFLCLFEPENGPGKLKISLKSIIISLSYLNVKRKEKKRKKERRKKRKGAKEKKEER